MTIQKFWFVLLTLTLATMAAIPNSAGWYQIPNTAISSVCACTHGFPQTCGNSNCGGIFAWSSGLMDTKRNRLVVWGGGHTDYYGNEIYALDLNALTMKRITDPTLPVASGCVEGLSGGTPNSRHTYDHICYMTNEDKLFSFAGSIACGPSGVNQATWTFDFTAMKWQRLVPTGTLPRAAEGMLSAYDPNTGKVFFHDLSYLHAYDPSNNTWTRLNSTPASVDYHLCATIDPKRKKFVALGSGEAYIADIGAGSSYAWQTLTTTGGSAVIGAGYPGLAYDAVRDRIVGWTGGNTVYSLNLDTKQWTSDTYSGGPGSQNSTGTYDRWSYSPALNCFVLVNTVSQNAYTFRFPGSAVEAPLAVSAGDVIQISPNPVTSGLATITLGSSSRLHPPSFLIFDLNGRQVARSKGHIWDPKNVPAGLYVAKAVAGGKMLSTRFLICR